MKMILAMDSRVIFFGTALMTALLAPVARAQVRSLTLGIDTNCPYGLAE
jgi:hypothetical protein